jgi:hypothetical protein
MGDMEIVSLDGKRNEKKSLNGVILHNLALFKECTKLISYMCPFTCNMRFRSLRDLQTHLKRDHEGVMYCDVCLDFRQAFLPEQTLFPSVTSLQTHYKSEHATCEFCKHGGPKFYSSDELVTHMNQVHFRCTVCDRLDYQNEYYCNFDSFSAHVNEAHYPCEYPECKEQRIVAFPDEAELKLHWIEKHRVSNRVIPLGGVGVGKKFRNRVQQVEVSSHVHFRGPRGMVNYTTAPAANTVHAYPDDPAGAVYDKRRHEVKRSESPTYLAKLKSELARNTRLLSVNSDAYKAANVLFRKKLETRIPEKIDVLKSIALEFKQGDVDQAEFLDKSFAILGDVHIDLLAELIALLPDMDKRSELIRFISGDPKESVVVSRRPQPPLSRPNSVVPSDLFTGSLPGAKKPSLLHALYNLLDGNEDRVVAPVADKSVLPQVILSAMENKINGLDRIQLTTLSEMRHQLLILAEGTYSSLSWANCDTILSLRPLLYRLMHVPETHRGRAAELESTGWSEFSRTAREIFASKFSNNELVWIKAYITLSLLRLGTIGPLETRRTDFPSIRSQAPPPVHRPAAPTRADFPNILPSSSSSANQRLWQNDISRVQQDAFPGLAAPDRPPVVNSNWSCSRCTYMNTRALAICCEICGMERTEPDAVTETTPAPTNGRNKKTKQRIVLSSATQRDYTR